MQIMILENISFIKYSNFKHKEAKKKKKAKNKGKKNPKFDSFCEKSLL